MMGGKVTTISYQGYEIEIDLLVVLVVLQQVSSHWNPSKLLPWIFHVCVDDLYKHGNVRCFFHLPAKKT